MHYYHSYVDELEFFITQTLLPVYIENQIAKGNSDPLKDINPLLLKQIRSKKKVSALLLPLGYYNSVLDPKLH